MELHLDHNLEKIHLKIEEAKAPRAVIIIAHGAGAGMGHPFMQSLATSFPEQRMHAVRFNFPYMEAGKKAPGSQKKNMAVWETVIAGVKNHYPTLPVFLSGKSYGGRMASHVLSEQVIDQVHGVVYFGFPLHAPGKDGTERAAHLGAIQVPQLFLQGTKDKLANISLIKEVVSKLQRASLYEIPHGDHSFKVPKAANTSPEEILKTLTDETVTFIQEILASMQP